LFFVFLFVFICFVFKLDDVMDTLQTQPKGCGYRVKSNWLMFRRRRFLACDDFVPSFQEGQGEVSTVETPSLSPPERGRISFPS
jgi:hypothetical protein